MDRIVTTKAIMPPSDWGLYALVFMQVCAESDATDQELLDHCNSSNPAGTRNGWSKVVREDHKWGPKMDPVACEKHPGRTHFLVTC